MRSAFETSHLAFLVEHAGKLMSRYQGGRDGRNLQNECTSCRSDLEVQDKRNSIPSG